MSTSVRWAYKLLLTLGLPLYVLRLLWRARAEPLYRAFMGERLGWYGRRPPSSGWVWVHAVSLGETRAAAALIDALRAEQPALRLLLTHSTATGREAGRALLRPGDQQCWLPYDTPGAVRRFFRHFRPAVGVLMETEIWPQLMHQADRDGLPVVLANARLSERSLRRGRRLSALLFPAVRQLRLILAQSAADAERFAQVGAETVTVSGNLKFDMTISAELAQRGQAWHAQLQRPVVLAASTREGEETALLAAWQARSREVAPNALLLIVPRHPQRFHDVWALIQSTGLKASQRSRWASQPDLQSCQADVWLGDSLGEMALYFSLADVALLGGSFAPLGGQNLIEAAACGCPVVMGPHTFNFAQASELAIQAQAAWRVQDLPAAVALACTISARPDHAVIATQAKAFADQHRGAARTMARHICQVLPRP